MSTPIASVEAIVLADIHGRIQHWSSGAEQLFGYPKSEAEGQLLDLIIPEEYRGKHWEGFHSAMATGVSRLHGAATNIPVRCRDGNVRLFPARLVLIKYARDCPVGAMGIFATPSGQERLFGPIV